MIDPLSYGQSWIRPCQRQEKQEIENLSFIESGKSKQTF